MQTEIRNLAQWIKEELHNEYNRMLPERAQKTMSVFELSVYSPTIFKYYKIMNTFRLVCNSDAENLSTVDGWLGDLRRLT